MKSSYSIEGMTCANCVAKVKSKLQAMPDLEEIHVQLDHPQLNFKSKESIDISTIQTTIPEYQVSSIEATKVKENNLPDKSLSTYKPLIIIVGFILGTSILAQYPFKPFDFMTWMRHFMAGFFIVFSFFKMLNISGFATSYQMYDVVAKRWPSWGFIYPFIELALGVLYLINIYPHITNYLTIVVLAISSIGVIQSNLNKQRIKCACLGDVFNLPMSTVTIIEDLSMLLMAIAMLAFY